MFMSHINEFRLVSNVYRSKKHLNTPISLVYIRQSTIKGGSRRAEKSRKVLMMMKAAKLGWAGSGAGQEQTMSSTLSKAR